MTGFAVEVFQNEYLPEGGRDISAIVTVTSADDDLAPEDDAGGAEIIMIDCSGSMARHGKIAAARQAAAVAIDAIRDGVTFAVVAGHQGARMVFPAEPGLAVADPQARAAAQQAVAGLRGRGGTAIGQWLRLAHQLFTSSPAALRHAILLTDGKNGEMSGQLDKAIALCQGVFTCDCRGVGTGWNVRELRKISTALLGTVDIVPDPAGLAADFASMMRTAMSKTLPDVALRLWMPAQASIQFVRQVAPAVDDLTGRRVPAGPQAGDYPTGSWGAGESRDYHVRVAVTPAAIGQEMLAARVSLLVDSQVVGQGLIRAVWTDEEALATRISPQVAHFTGQAELAQAIQEGLEARKRGDRETATARLGRAAMIAQQSGNEDTARLLARVVDVVDAASGTVRLKKRVDDADEMALDTRSTKTVRTRK
ncbi:MAG TPA: VWA domain-containing protein [Streptosporangiaceae bacterium]|nr:VWA domain-containing protein [Streptosporangiaceae bacterium]